MPVPVSATVCGLPAALSATLTFAVRVPEAVGVNVTLMEQDAPAATDPPQVLVSEKSPAFAPVMLTLVTVNVAVPLLVRVTTKGALDVPTVWLANARLAGVNTTLAAMPVPVSGTVCGLVLPLSVMVSVPGKTPVVVGVKVTPIVHVAAEFTAVPQLLVSE
jgi:hypothetical protein